MPSPAKTSVVPFSNERWILGAAVLCGFLLRWWALSLLAIEHHDEAVYASNLLFSAASGAEYPGRAFYAPPLLPLLIEWTVIFGQIVGLTHQDWLPFLPGLVCGTALIPSVWWIGRRWFSPAGGLAAAWLVALSEYHAFYSRTALTDPVVLLWLVWAVYWSWVALGDGRWRSAIIAGLLTASAWWTKYTGWLPIAIAASGGLCHLVLTHHSQRDWLKYLRVIGTMAVTAFIVWSPVLWDCASVGGYSAVAANHRGYLQGWSAWLGNWWRQNQSLSWYTAPLTVASYFFAVWAALMWPRSDLALGQPEAGRCEPGMMLGLAGVLCLLVVWDAPLLAAALAGGCAALIAWSSHRDDPLSPEEIRAGCLLTAWWTGLLLTTPLYQPYPRLCLPLWLAGVFGVAWACHRLTHLKPFPETYQPVLRGYLHTPLACCALTAVVAIAAMIKTTVWEPRRSALDVALQIRAEIPSAERAAFYVYADPALFYQLSQLNLAAIPRGDLPVQPVATADQTFLVLGSSVDDLPGFHQTWETLADHYELFAEIPVQPSSLVQLDQSKFDPRPSLRGVRLASVRLYRVR